MVSKREPANGESLYSFKGVGVINAPPSKVKDLVRDVTLARRWDSMCKEGKVIEVIDENTSVINLMYETRMCILKTARDFCILYHTFQSNGTYILVRLLGILTYIGREID